MSAPRRAGRASRADTREQVLRRLAGALEARLAAGEIYRAISVESLVREVGLAKSTFYFYFEDKAALLAAATEDVQAEFLAAAQGWFTAGFPLARDALRDRLRLIADAYRQHEALLGAVVDAASQDSAVRAVYLDSLRGFATGLQAHLEQGRTLGLLSRELEPSRTAQWLVWTFERGLHQMVRGADADTVRREIDTLAGLIWRAVYAADPIG